MIQAGETWTVDKTTKLDVLTIAERIDDEDVPINAPEGYSVTMTVDGVETPIKAGTYTGEIVLTPAQKITKALYKSAPFISRGQTPTGYSHHQCICMFLPICHAVVNCINCTVEQSANIVRPH